MASIRLIPAVCIALCTTAAQAQFTYIGADIGYGHLPLRKVGYERSAANRLEVIPHALYRFSKHFGLGAAMIIPASSKVKVTLDQSPTSDGYGYFDSYSYYGYVNDHRFSTLSYEASDRGGGSLFARLFLDDNANAYFDLRLTYARFTERFTMQRTGRSGYYDPNEQVWRQPVAKLDIDDRITHAMLVPGVTFGLSPHVGKHVYVNFYIGMDHYPFKKDAFSHKVSYSEDYNGDFGYVTFASRLSGGRQSFRTGMGVGLHF
ncbi:MAG TPA: hypothetical protein PKY96_10985 [Flavobacteriales bacterium]|nr:hypothetical protein [Flavobacteriales bacterium]